MIGKLIGRRYEVTEEILTGPLFSLFRVHDIEGNREVLVRVVEEPFNREAAFVDHLESTMRDLSSIRSPHIEEFSGLEREDDQVYLLSKGAAGQPLSERIKRLAPYSPPVAVGMVMQIAESLSTLHQNGVVHGELASRSILIGNDGAATLLALGLWVTYSSSRAAGPAVLPLVAAYLAPEVSQGQMPSPQSDVYALGVIFFELLTGRLPFSGETPVALASKHMTAPIPSVVASNRLVPPAVEEVVKKCLAKEPSERYQSAQALVEELSRIQESLRFGKAVKWSDGAATTASTTPAASAEAKVETEPEADPAKPEKVKKQKPTPDPSKPITQAPGCVSWFAYAAIMCALVIGGAFWAWSKSAPKVIKVPDVIGLQFEDAKAELAKKGLELRRSGQQFNDKSKVGQVLKVDPPVGDDAKMGAPIFATVSAGSQFVTVPDLKGMTVEEATAKLATVDLEVNQPVDEELSRRAKVGTILNQVPSNDTKVERGTRVRLTIASNRRVTREKTTGTYDLVVKLPKELNRVALRVDIVDMRGELTIHEDTHRGGESIEIAGVMGEGNSVIFKIYYNGQLVKQVEKVIPEARVRIPEDGRR